MESTNVSERLETIFIQKTLLILFYSKFLGIFHSVLRSIVLFAERYFWGFFLFFICYSDYSKLFYADTCICSHIFLFYFRKLKMYTFWHYVHRISGRKLICVVIPNKIYRYIEGQVLFNWFLLKLVAIKVISSVIFSEIYIRFGRKKSHVTEGLYWEV